MFGFFYTFGVNYNDHSELEQKLDTGVIVARSLTLSIFWLIYWPARISIDLTKN